MEVLGPTEHLGRASCPLSSCLPSHGTQIKVVKSKTYKNIEYEKDSISCRTVGCARSIWFNNDERAHVSSSRALLKRQEDTLVHSS